jgi:hypothetical protein
MVMVYDGERIPLPNGVPAHLEAYRHEDGESYLWDPVRKRHVPMSDNRDHLRAALGNLLGWETIAGRSRPTGCEGFEF